MTRTYEVVIRIHRGRASVSDNFAEWEAKATADFVNGYLAVVQKKMPYCRAQVREVNSQ